MNLKVTDIAYHRNGVSGAGFCVLRFVDWAEDLRRRENYLAIVFEEPGHCAVLSLDRLPVSGIDFGLGNSWRGDIFEPELRKAIKKYEKL